MIEAPADIPFTFHKTCRDVQVKLPALLGPMRWIVIPGATSPWIKPFHAVGVGFPAGASPSSNSESREGAMIVPNRVRGVFF